MTKILFLGAAAFQLGPIKYAKERGYYVITCDNNPNNPGHRIADKAYNVSTTNKEEILKISKFEKIDGIMTYGSDISVPTVAYVCEQLLLPGPSQKAINFLVNKNQFRKISEQNIKFEMFNDFIMAKKYISRNVFPIVTKPVDSAGSKGVSIVKNINQVDVALNYAFEHSLSGRIILEEYINKKGKQVCGDGFMFNGKLSFVCFGDGHFYDDHEFLAPWGETFPSTSNPIVLDSAKSIIENILVKCGYLSGPFNIDLFIDINENIFINEIGPRNGGNFIPQVIKYSTGVDLIEASVEYCWNKNFDFNPTENFSPKYFYSSYMLHSKDEDIEVIGIEYDLSLKKCIIEENIFFKGPIVVNKFKNGSKSVGNLILTFRKFDEMNQFYMNINDKIKWILKY